MSISKNRTCDADRRVPRAASRCGVAALATALVSFSACAHASDVSDRSRVEKVVNETVQPLMREYAIPGLAVAVTVRGQRHVFNFGVASKETGRPVNDATIFEIGSISKTTTALLASYAQATGKLSLSDSASQHLPALKGSSFDRVSLLELGTYTAGGLPLQFPAGVTDQEGMIAYYKNWRPAYEPSTQRVYSNPSLGLFGHLAARSMGEPFDALMEGKLLPMLGLRSTFVRVPPARLDDYAFGYAKEDKPIRVNPGLLDAEAYGLKTTAADLIRFVEANIDPTGLDASLRRAVTDTHFAHYRVGDMRQGLGWEMFDYPVALERLVAGTTTEFALKPSPATKLEPPVPPRKDAWIHKTGATNGFGAYAAFIPAERIGIVLLANRNYPNAARVAAAHRILAVLASRSAAPGAR